MPDREKVIKEYEDYVNSYIPVTTYGDYVLEMHKAVLALLKEQPKECKSCGIVFDIAYKAGKESIVRCKDCKHGRQYDTNAIDCEYRELATEPDWFCADGEQKDGDGSA